MGNNWSDTGNLISKMTPARLSNSVKVLASYYQSRTSAKPKISGLPISLSFEPTTSCNLRCPECPSGLRAFTRPTGMLSSDLYRQVIDELHQTLIYLTLYFQGEPYLHPDFFDLISYASERNIYTATSTNAHYLSSENARKTVESGLDRLIISLDGIDQETYENYRVGGSMNKVIEGIRQLIHWKRKLKSKTPHTILQFLVFRQNEHQVDDVKKLGKKLGVDRVALKTAQINDFEKGSNLIPLKNEYSRYAQNGNGSWKIKNKLLDHCWKMWQGSVITWDGKVIPCCFDKDANHMLGNVSQNNFSEIWTSQDYTNFRAKILRSRSTVDICTNCTEGTKVWT